MMPPLRTLKIANLAILSYNPRNLLEKRFQTRNRITYHDLQKKKSFSRHKTPLWDLLSAAIQLVRVGQASHLSSRTVRRRDLPGTLRQPGRQPSEGRHKSPQAFQLRIH